MAEAQNPPEGLVPPLVEHHHDAVYPAVELAAKKHAEVVLVVTIDGGGHVTNVDVAESGGKAFDDAATTAMREWTFVPAKRGDRPVASKIKVPFHFAPPEEPATDEVLSPGIHGAVAAPAPPASAAAPIDVTVRGAVTTPQHGASDFHVTVGALRLVPRANASDFLKLVPGILLTNEGGEGHAEQVFLRGFDAREGQDIEFSVDGIPINDSGNPHGNGYADTHFIIPELVQSLRVTEGPFNPAQGNYAVAGSADYQLGLENRGLTAKATYGSWNTERLLLAWGPQETSTHTFAAVEAYKTEGYGANRAAKRTTAMAQYEIPLASGATLKIGGQAYATHFQTAGVVRLDDYKSGRVGFYGTEDPLQGGDASRFSIYATFDKTAESSALSQSLFLIRRDMRLREDFTGFLQDTQDALDTLHPQRGDLIDVNYGAWTLGGKGLARYSTEINGLKQSIDFGYLARVDLTNATQYRNTVPGDVPYKINSDLDSTLTDLGLYADGSLKPLRWLTFRGGVRVDTFSFNVLNKCAAQGDFDNPSKSDPPTNESCHDQLPFGAHREPVQRSSTGAMKVMPRATAIVGPFQGFNFSASYGTGVRAIDPIYISQDLNTPFASVEAYEGGATYADRLGPVNISARSIFFQTKVDRDLVFSQTVGRNVLSNGTTRTGWAGALRLNGSFFDESANLTFVRARYDDTHLEVPYIPATVFRDDLAIFHDLPWTVREKSIRGTLSLGWTYVGSRSLPYGEKSNTISTVDANANVGWAGWDLGLSITNFLNRQYRLGEYNYASDFHSQPEPTLIAARAFTAGAPRGAFLSLSTHFGGGA